MPEYLIAHVGHTSKSYEHICWWKPESKKYAKPTPMAPSRARAIYLEPQP